MNDTTRRILRSLLQIIGGGGIAALVTQVALDTPDAYDPYIIMAGSAIAAVAQLIAEELTGHDIGVKRASAPKGKV